MVMAGLSVNPAYGVYQYFWRLLDWIYPPHCAGCGELGMRWCNVCIKDVIKLGNNICPICGLPQSGERQCNNCGGVAQNYEAIRSWGIFDGTLRIAIHQLKYMHNIGLGESLSIHLIDRLLMLDWHVDLIVPVPLSLQRLRERGYNQSALLSRPLSLAAGIPFKSKALLRIKETRTQVGLNSQERFENVEGAFWADSSQVKHKNILVIDDLTTTGATIRSCAHALKESGCSSVYGLTLARTVF